MKEQLYSIVGIGSKKYNCFTIKCNAMFLSSKCTFNMCKRKSIPKKQ